MRLELNESAAWTVSAIALACMLSWCCLQASSCQALDYRAKVDRCKVVAATSIDTATIAAVCKVGP